MMRKLNPCFYVEVLRMVFSIAESAKAQFQNAQLNFCKAQDIIACTKASVTSAINDARLQRPKTIIDGYITKGWIP